MSILKWLGLTDVATPDDDERPNAVAEIAARLDELPPADARRLAAFALVLARAARADLEVSEVESQRMVEIVMAEGGLDRERAELVAGMAAHRHQLLGAGQDYLATREFRQVSDAAERARLLRCLFAVTAADESISSIEEEELRQVASELGIEHAEFTTIRSEFSQHREVLRGLGRLNPKSD